MDGERFDILPPMDIIYGAEGTRPSMSHQTSGEGRDDQAPNALHWTCIRSRSLGEVTRILTMTGEVFYAADTCPAYTYVLL